MNEEECKALFILAGIPIAKLHRLENKYWPDSDHYADIRRRSPWWLVQTQHGPVEIGWRKRVVSIRWEDTPVRFCVTPDDVTKDETMVHAWSYAKAVEYLTTLGAQFRTLAHRARRRVTNEAERGADSRNAPSHCRVRRRDLVERVDLEGVQSRP